MRVFPVLAALLASSGAFATDSGPCPSLPKNSRFEWTHNKGPDFDVCYGHLKDEGAVQFGLYLGFAPKFHPSTDLNSEKGSVGGHAVMWLPKTGKDVDFAFGRDALLQLKSKGNSPPLQVHVWILAKTKEQLEQLKAVLKGIRFKPEDSGS